MSFSNLLTTRCVNMGLSLNSLKPLATKLRITQPHVERPFRIPGGMPGVFVVGGIGLLGCVGGIVFGFFPPSQSDIEMSPGTLVPLVSIGFIVTMILPFIFFQCRREEWAERGDLPRAEEARKRWIRGD